jgi:hypothetical protein
VRGRSTGKRTSTYLSARLRWSAESASKLALQGSGRIFGSGGFGDGGVGLVEGGDAGGLAVAGEGEDFDVGLRGPFGGGEFIQGWNQISDGDDGGGGLVGADLAVEIPEIEAFREFFAALTFQVFTDVAFDGFEDACVVFAGNVKGEGFLHFGGGYTTNPDEAAGLFVRRFPGTRTCAEWSVRAGKDALGLGRRFQPRMDAKRREFFGGSRAAFPCRGFSEARFSESTR